ncbi:MAG: PDZ domain-containing protein [bacterium]|nr:PDZ domain-containing protein [bacterium]
MNSRAFGFFSLLLVIGASIVFGMLLGGKLNAPDVAHAAPMQNRLELAPARYVPSGSETIADVVEQSLPAVVSVTATQLTGKEAEESEGEDVPEMWEWLFPPEDEQRGPNRRPRVGEGSGFVISDDGYVLTNNHVVEDADQIEVGMQDGRKFAAEVVGADPSIDLALLKVNPRGETLPTLPLGDSESLRVGEWVIAIGNPLDFEQTVTVGVVSAKERRVPIGATDSMVVSFIQTDAAINFGNSGGPLLDGAGNVIGINTAIRRANFAEGIGFALPINHARAVMDQLLDRGYVRRGYIGITMNRNGIDDTAREWYGLPDGFGVIIDDVAGEGPAERAGLKKGDIIRKVNGERVRDNRDLVGKIASHQPGDHVELEVFRRGGRTFTARATLEDRDEGLAAINNRPLPDREERRATPKSGTGLGITVENLTRELRESMGLGRSVRGVIVADVTFDSEAADKGLLRNSIITKINDDSIAEVDHWIDVVEDLGPGAAVKMEGLQPNGTIFTVFLRVPGQAD